MSERKSWVGHHDFINSGDIRLEHKHNEAMLEAKFHGDLNQFRVKATEKLDKHGGLANGGGVAIFSQEVMVEDGSLRTVNTFLHAKSFEQTEAHIKPPSIRIIRNELIVNGESGEILAVDFAANQETDVQYLVDAYSPKQAALETDAWHTLAPVFIVDEDEIKITSNYAAFTPVLEVIEDDVNLKEVRAIPFGSYLYLEDKIHALSIGEELLDSLDSEEPVHIESY